MSKENLRSRSLLVRTIYAVCLAGAGYNHAVMNIQHGLFWNYGGGHLISSIFWTSLTFLDPLAAILLFVKARLGVALTIAIITADVIHNSWVLLHDRIQAGTDYFAQVLFLLFVAFTAKIASRHQAIDVNY